jgi:chromosome segregation ATPase
MQTRPPLDAALRRLNAALDQLEAAVERRLGEERRHAGLEAQVQALGVDRARLASELDQTKHRAEGLESANREVSERLTAAMETIRTVLEDAER